jgi:hypothetical protein
MTAAEVLAKVLRAGGRVVPDAVAPKLLVPSSLKPLVVEHRDALRALLASQEEAQAPRAPDLIAAYQRVLERLWYLAGQGPDANHRECAALLQEQARLCDELGAEWALTVSRQAARDWSAREGRCAYCAMPGIFHDPDTGEDLPVGAPRR